MESKVTFGDIKLKEAYTKLKTSKTEDQMLYKWITRAIDDLKVNAFCGTQVPKRVIPKIYTEKYETDNLWKYDLPKGWRLIYTIANGEVLIISIILEWMTHKDYEKRFKY
ncbi:hypothetical protein JXA12_02830 [Candidatus Woesearchaeota archaeon]|nr:hypothetical protein [Candidatus Woesearchaeota archaeon]